MPMLMTCDFPGHGCGKSFQGSPTERDAENGDLEIVVVCPHCSFAYELFGVRRSGRRIYEDLLEARSSLKGAPNRDARRRVSGRVERLTNALKPHYMPLATAQKERLIDA